MAKVTLGRTGISVNKNGFGALPIQRLTFNEADRILRRAYENGINFYDTARMYSDSEEKIGKSLSAVRDKIYIASKTTAQTAEEFRKDLKTSLTLLKTDYLDILQFHNPPFCPVPGDGSGLYEEMEKAKEKGYIRFIGLTNHRMKVAREAAESGYYDSIQYPFSYLASSEDEELVKLCGESNLGFIAMKALSGGLINDGSLAYGFMSGYENVLPIWGIQKMEELEQFLECEVKSVALTAEMEQKIAEDRKSLCGEFCRGCGYCMPCPVGIEINNCARMSLMLRRAPSAAWLTEGWQEKMKAIENCEKCGICKSRCPYGLDIPVLLEKNLADYKTFL